MDLAQLSAIVDKEVLPSLNAVPLADMDSPSVASPGRSFFTKTSLMLIYRAEFVKSVGELIEEHLNAQKAEDAPEWVFIALLPALRL